VATEVDGRHRRSQESRERIATAMLDLVREGAAPPSAEQVAAGAQVGLRTVFRHFKDMDGLYREMSKAIESELLAAAAVPFEAADWRGQVVEMVGRRGVLFERIGPIKRASDALKHRSQVLGADYHRLAAGLRLALTQVMPEEARAGRDRLEALDLSLSFESWARLRNDQNLAVRSTQAVLERAVRRLLGMA
jgi:AcrR family transcriptional regulator